ncbi:hypothetical protein Tco_0387459 [Tanacetum coccineum]
MDYSLTYIGYLSVLEGYTDASWVFLLGGGAISWASKKQTCITNLTIESEFVALAATSKEAEWLRNLILEILLWSKPIAPISIRCDSDATLSKVYSKMYNEKSRHLCVRHNMIRELIMNGVVSIEFASLNCNIPYFQVLGYEDQRGAVADINEDGFCHPNVTIPLLPDFGGVTDGTRAKNPSSLSDIHARIP